MGHPVLSPWDFDQGTGGCSQVGERRVGAQAVVLGKVLPGAGFGILSWQGHLLQVIAFILPAVTETHFIPAPSNPALTARAGVLWGVRPFLQAGLGEESPSQICPVEKSIPRDGKVQ